MVHPEVVTSLFPVLPLSPCVFTKVGPWDSRDAPSQVRFATIHARSEFPCGVVYLRYITFA